MKKSIENIILKDFNHPNPGEKAGYADEKLFMATSAKQFSMQTLRKGQTYQVEEGRVMRILSGNASCTINLHPYALQPQMLLCIAPGSIFEIESYTNDFDLQAFSLTDLPQEATVKDCSVFSLPTKDWQLTETYFRLLWEEINHPAQSQATISFLQAALLARLHALPDEQPLLPGWDDRFNRFITLLNLYGIQKRNIAFYAGQLCVTPNHLGFAVKKASGLTAMQWINRHIVQQAKIQLKYTSLPIGEIAELLQFSTSSSFSKFFKKETGMTPRKYRNS